MKSGIDLMRQLSTLSVKNKKMSKKEENYIRRSFVSLCDDLDELCNKQKRVIISKPIDKTSKV